MALKEIKDDFEGEKFKFETIGQTLEGYFDGTIEVNINGKMTKKHNFTTKDGTTVGTLGSVDLTKKLSKAVVGAFSQITLRERKKIPGQPQPLKIFKVLQDDSDMRPEGLGSKANGAVRSTGGSTHSSTSIKNQQVLS